MLSGKFRFLFILFCSLSLSLGLSQLSAASNSSASNLSYSFTEQQHKKDRAKLREIYKETKRISKNHSHGLNKKLTQSMVYGTRPYKSRKNGNLIQLNNKREFKAPSKRLPNRFVKTRYQIMPVDSFSSANQLIKQGLNPLVLNMANKKAIGGGVEWGSKAQEECLFRASNYHLALYPKGQGKPNKHPDRKYYHYPIAEFGSYYTPNVQVFRDNSKNYAFIKPFSVSCIALAGYDLSKPYKLERRIMNSAGIDLRAFKKYTKVKIRHLLEVAMLNNHDSLVLGAISCGAFRLPNDNSGLTARIVAEAYKEVLREPRYRGRFTNITFAILPRGNVGKINYQIFDKMVKQL